jgi:hypothetical protein
LQPAGNAPNAGTRAPKTASTVAKLPQLMENSFQPGKSTAMDEPMRSFAFASPQVQV